jgi:hypothetical protein
MNIKFSGGKENKCYEDFVNNPTDRKVLRKFKQFFPDSIADEAVKRHQLLSVYETAAKYNEVYGKSENRIEFKKSTKDKDPFILKVRITGAWRKFFHCVVDDEGNLLLTKHWTGQFCEVQTIYVIDVNKHDYNKV